MDWSDSSTSEGGTPPRSTIEQGRTLQTWSASDGWPVVSSTDPTGIAGTDIPGDVHEVEPPPDWRDYSFCDFAVDSEADCYLEVNPLTEAEFWTVVQGAPMAEIIDFQNGGTAGRQMIRRAWAMVLHALERGLGEWAYCWFVGDWQGSDSDESACLLRHFAGDSFERVEVEFDDNQDPGGPMTAQSDEWYRPGRIYVHRTNVSWQLWHNVWTTGRTTDRYCAAMNIAQALFHEMIHVCDNTSSDPNPQYQCYETYIVSSIFSFALAHLHPYTMESDCCNHWWTNAPSDGGVAEGSALFATNGWKGIPITGDYPTDASRSACWRLKPIALPRTVALPRGDSSDTGGTLMDRPDCWSDPSDDDKVFDWPYTELER